MPPTSAEQENLAGLLSPAFGKAAFRVDRRRPLTFICGGNNHNGVEALRHQFLKKINTPTRRILAVLSEQAFPHQLIERNLQKFEEFLARTADCVLIFVESAGSFAETGLFSALPEIVKKTFVVNTREESGKVSFLNLGPIKLIRKTTMFDTIFDLDKKVVTAADANGIVQHILNIYPKFQNALVFHPERKFTDLNLRLQLACVYMAITLMRAGSLGLVTKVLRGHFKAVDEETVERYLSVLTSINVLQREDEIFFNPNQDPKLFTDDALIHSVDFSLDNLRMRALEWQAKNNSHVAAFLRERCGVDI